MGAAKKSLLSKVVNNSSCTSLLTQTKDNLKNAKSNLNRVYSRFESKCISVFGQFILQQKFQSKGKKEIGDLNTGKLKNEFQLKTMAAS